MKMKYRVGSPEGDIHKHGFLNPVFSSNLVVIGPFINLSNIQTMRVLFYGKSLKTPVRVGIKTHV